MLILRSCEPLVHESDHVLTADQAREMVESLSDAQLLEIEDVNHFSIVLAKLPSVMRPVAAFLGTSTEQRR